MSLALLLAVLAGCGGSRAMVGAPGTNGEGILTAVQAAPAR